MKKTIILGYDRWYGLEQEFIKNLEFLGYEVIPITTNNCFTYKNKIQRVISFILKKFFNNKEIEKNLKIDQEIHEFNKKINNRKIDFSLIIRPDKFPISFLKKNRKIANKTVAYQWDGLGLFSDALKSVKYFDRFFVFDPNDVDIDKNLLPSTNFYFDYNLDSENKKTGDGKKVYFFGTFINYRMNVIADLSAFLVRIGYTPDIYVVTHPRDNIKPYENTKINFLKKGISYEENICKMKDADVLVDFINGKHCGLSFRTFEAIGYDKKLITTNAEIKKYDFYNPNNIFVLNNDNLTELNEFLEKPYEPLPIEIKQKYSFTNWIKYIFDEKPYQEINLPFDKNIEPTSNAS